VKIYRLKHPADVFFFFMSPYNLFSQSLINSSTFTSVVNSVTITSICVY